MSARSQLGDYEFWSIDPWLARPSRTLLRPNQCQTPRSCGEFDSWKLGLPRCKRYGVPDWKCDSWKLCFPRCKRYGVPDWRFYSLETLPSRCKRYGVWDRLENLQLETLLSRWKRFRVWDRLDFTVWKLCLPLCKKYSLTLDVLVWKLWFPGARDTEPETDWMIHCVVAPVLCAILGDRIVNVSQEASSETIDRFTR